MTSMSTALSPLVQPIPYAVPTAAQQARLIQHLAEPLLLRTPTGNVAPFVLPADFFTLTFQEPATADDRPTATLAFSADGWERLSYTYLTGMAQAAKKNPKAVPRSMRPFAKLMDRLPEHPTGTAAIDAGRRMILDKNTQAIQAPVRALLTQRLRDWRPGA